MEGKEQWKVQVKQWLEQGLELVHQIPPIQLYVAVGVFLLTTFLLLFTRLFRRRKSNTIVLSGLSGSGKTVLFCQLRDGSSHQGTVTSMEPNEGTFMLHSEIPKKDKLKPVHLVDVPGHSRLRAKLDDFLPQAAGVVFVVDALDFLPNCRAASEYLYDIFTNASVVKKKIPVLILCNKTDKVTAHTKEFINRQMEKEIDKLRVSRSAISAADISNDFTLGVPGKSFSFTQCHNRVSVAEASGLTEEVACPCLRLLIKNQNPALHIGGYCTSNIAKAGSFNQILVFPCHFAPCTAFASSQGVRLIKVYLFINMLT